MFNKKHSKIVRGVWVVVGVIVIVSMVLAYSPGLFY